MRVPFSYSDRQFQDVDAYLADLRDFIKTGDFTLGKPLVEFEKRFAELCRMPYAIGVGSGTDALAISMKMLGIGSGDEVITTPTTFIATVGAIVMTGARPVFVDSEDGFVIDPTKIEAAITPQTKAILPVHFTGNIADMPAIAEIANQHGLFIVEDACQAILGSIDDRPVGSWGEAAGFSLHPLKNLNVWSDGGVVVTRSADLAEKIRLYRNHGLINRDEVVSFGCNSRLDTIQAVIGNRLITQTDWITKQRIQFARRYDEAFADLKEWVQVPPRRPGVQHVYHLYLLRVERRDDLLKHLQQQGVEAKIHYPIPVHLQKAAIPLGYKTGDFPVSERDARSIITLPVHQHLSHDEVEYTIKQVRAFYGQNQGVRSGLASTVNDGNHVHLDFDNLVSEYLENLNVTLRGFEAAKGHDFLQSWVPSDNPTDSIVDLLELAQQAHLNRLTIVVNVDTLAKLEMQKIESSLLRKPRRMGDAAELEFSLNNGNTFNLLPCYQKRLAAMLADVRREGTVDEVPGQEIYADTQEGQTLEILVNSVTRIVTQARFHGARTPTQRGLMECLCRVMERKPIQECADHALIYVENELRDTEQPSPIAGVILPDNTDPAFLPLQQHVRALLTLYRASTGYERTDNFYDAPVSTRWGQLNNQQRCDEIRAVLEGTFAKRQVSLIGMERPKRAVVQFSREMNSADKQTLLAKLERILRSTLEPGLHLVAEVKADKNILRLPDRKAAS